MSGVGNKYTLVNPMRVKGGARWSGGLADLCVIAALWCWPVLAMAQLGGDLAPRGQSDGKLDSADVLVLQRVVAGELTPTTTERLVGDVAPLGQPDGVLNAADILVLQRAVLGLVTLPQVWTEQDLLAVQQPVFDMDSPPPPASPTPIQLGRITIGDIVNGNVTVTGGPASASLDDTIVITNTRTGAQVSVFPNADGSFSATLAAQVGDSLSLVTRNATGSSAATLIAVMQLTITAPTAGATLSGERALVSGTLQAPVNTGVTVNGVTAAVTGTQFIATIPLVSGNNTITAVATAQSGSTTSRSITVTATAVVAPPVQVDAAPQGGTAPLVVRFRVSKLTEQPLNRFEIDANGDGSRDYLSVFFDTPIEHTYTTPGVYPAKVTVTDMNGIAYVSTHTIVVTALGDMDALLSGIYSGMLQRLKAGDIDGALTAISGSMQSKYRTVFTTLKPSLATLVDQLGTIQAGSLGEDFAEYVLVRTENGKSVAYLIHFIRGEDGVWRIDGM